MRPVERHVYPGRSFCVDLQTTRLASGVELRAPADKGMKRPAVSERASPWATSCIREDDGQ